MERPNFGSAPTPAKPTEAAKATEGQDPVQRHKRLSQEHARLNENRVRRTLLLQQATEEDQRCQREAAEYGASTPEELEAILAARREEESRALDAFERELNEEAQRQREVEENLAAIEK